MLFVSFRVQRRESSCRPPSISIIRCAEDFVCCRWPARLSRFTLAGKPLNDSRDQQQQAAGDQRQFPGNQEQQDAKNQRHADVNDHARPALLSADGDAPGFGGQRIQQFPGIVGVTVALAHTRAADEEYRSAMR